jgi:hypothetical protein
VALAVLNRLAPTDFIGRLEFAGVHGNEVATSSVIWGHEGKRS